jgi:hypothetical protein
MATSRDGVQRFGPLANRPSIEDVKPDIAFGHRGITIPSRNRRSSTPTCTPAQSQGRLFISLQHTVEVCRWPSKTDREGIASLWDIDEAMQAAACPSGFIRGDRSA